MADRVAAGRSTEDDHPSGKFPDSAGTVIPIPSAAVPADVLEALRVYFPTGRVRVEQAERFSISGVRGMTLGESLEDVSEQQEWLDKNDPIDRRDWDDRFNKWQQGKGPKPERKTPPPPRVRPPVYIDCVYMIEFTYQVGPETGRERIVIFHKKGGGTDLVYGVKFGERWKDDVKAIIR